MPKLEGLEEKYWGEYKIDKENKDTIYSDEKHVYIDKNDNKPFISVTTLIHNYSQEFDEEFWSAYKALEALLSADDFAAPKRVLLTTKKFNLKLVGKLGLDEVEFLKKQQSIKDEYARKREASCERGTAIHAMFENSFYNRNKFDFGKYGLYDVKGDFECKKNYYELDLKNGVYPEFLISLTSRDGILKLAGQIDLLIKKDFDIWIIDWKSNAKIVKESYYNKATKKREMMKYPLNNLQDTNYWHYCLQLSTYAYMLQQIEPRYNIKGLELVHIDHDDKQHDYDIPYLKDDVERMLKHYKKQIKIQEALDKDKPFL